MNNQSFTPHSMLSPLGNISLFKKTKKPNGFFNGRSARSNKVRDIAVTIDNPNFGPKAVKLVRAYPAKRLQKIGGYKFFGEIVKGDFAALKARAKSLGFTHIRFINKLIPVS